MELLEAEEKKSDDKNTNTKTNTIATTCAAVIVGSSTTRSTTTSTPTSSSTSTPVDAMKFNTVVDSHIPLCGPVASVVTINSASLCSSAVAAIDDNDNEDRPKGTQKHWQDGNDTSQNEINTSCPQEPIAKTPATAVTNSLPTVSVATSSAITNSNFDHGNDSDNDNDRLIIMSNTNNDNDKVENVLNTAARSNNIENKEENGTRGGKKLVATISGKITYVVIREESREPKRLSTELKSLFQVYKNSKPTTAATAKKVTALTTATSSSNYGPSSIQLFASDFDIASAIQEGEEEEKEHHQQPQGTSSNETSDSTNNMKQSAPRRPKRTIKKVIKYQPSTRNYKQEYKLHQLSGKVGTGFLCPGCNMHLSYDAKKCWSCGMRCCYVPGTGVTVLSDRDSIASNFTLKEKDISLDDDVYDGVYNNDNNDSVNSYIGSSSGNNSELNNSSSSSLPGRTLRKRKAPSCIPVPSKQFKKVSLEVVLSQPKTKSQKSILMKYNDNIRECEACLELFQASYLQRHRKTFHNLPSHQFGCAYCSKSFSSMKSRNQHIRKVHKGRPLHLPQEIRDRTSMYLYNCPYCTIILPKDDDIDVDIISLPPLKKAHCYPMVYQDLKKHLLKVHDTDVNSVLSDITSSCPFCIEGSSSLKKERGLVVKYNSIGSLMSHISLEHESCDLIGNQLKIGNGEESVENDDDSDDGGEDDDIDDHVVEKRTRSNNRNNNINNQAKGGYDEEDKADDGDIYDSKNWNDLSFDSLRDFYNLDRSIVKTGQTFDTLSHFIHRKLTKVTYLEQCHIETQHSTMNGSGNDEYTAENKLYVRGLRERTGKAESEALEKITFKENWEENHRKIQYENRGKKKTPEEVEMNALLHRPFQFSSSKSRHSRRNVCNIGETCGLCNGEYANCIITEKEIKEAGGDIKSALSIDFSGRKRQEIRHLSFRYISDKDIPDDREEDQNNSKRRRGRGSTKSSENAWAEYWKLLEMKHSMDFIREYNNGLLHSWIKK